MDNMLARTFYRTEGIDTVSIEFFQEVVNKEMWRFPKRQISLGVSLEIRKSKYKSFYLCHIQAEALNCNIFLNVIFIVRDLCKRFYLNINPRTENLFHYVFVNRHSIFRLAELDFYFDFPRNTLQIPSEEVTGIRRFATTVYSKDHKKRKSLWIMYDRISDLLYRNQHPRDFIYSIPYPTRLEVRLCRANCAYLHFDNIRGDFYQIFSRYQSYIAKTWRKHGIIFGEIPLIEKHPFFNLILFLSTSNQPLHINGLEKTPRPLNKILEKDLFDSFENQIDSLSEKDSEIYDELIGDFDKYRIEHIHTINRHQISSYYRYK